MGNRPLREEDMYVPLKTFLEGQGFEVKAEIGKADIVGYDKETDTLILVETKINFGLTVINQVLDRLSGFDLVHIAVAVPEQATSRKNWDKRLPEAIRLCKFLGFGLMSLRDGIVHIHADPCEYSPRKLPKKRLKILKEFQGRSGDHNVGGTTRRPRVTVYRENALKCAEYLASVPYGKAAEVRLGTGVATASAILRSNTYGWFREESPGTVKGAAKFYSITCQGKAALEAFADVLSAQKAKRNP